MGGQLLQNGKQSFVDANGRPLAGGRVFFFSPGTQTFRDTWQDAALTILNTNPIILDARGEASIYGLGAYRQVLRSASGVLIWDQVLPDILSAVDDALDVFFASASKVVDNIAALRALDKTVNKNAFVLGYYGKGDGGGGNYFVDPIDTTSADNGGTVIVAADGARWNLALQSSVSIDQFGAKGDGVTDDSARIQAAFDFSSATGIPLTASAKTYGLALSQRIAIEGNSNAYTALVVKTRLRLTGAGMGKTIFKLLDGQSTALAPKWFNVMTGNTVITNLQLSNYTVDVNGQNNRISSTAAPLPGFQCAGLMITGSVASVGQDARLIDSVIDQVEVKNNPGVTNIGIGNRYGHPGTTGFGVVISRCKFYNSGIDSQDHSSVFAYGDNTLVIGCTFDHPIPSTGVRGPIVAVELHGSNNKMIDCTVRNYLQMAWIGAGDEGDRHDIVIANNSAEVGWWGIGLYSDPVLHGNMNGIVITGNTIRITGATILQPHLTGAKHALYLACGYNSNVLRLNISNNIFWCTDRTSNVGAYIGTDTGSFIEAALLSANIFSGFSRGVLIGAGGGSLGTITIQGGIIENCAGTTAVPSANTRGIDFRNANILSLSISGVSVSSGDVGEAPQIGINLDASGNVARIYMEGNNTGDCAVGIINASHVSGARSGRQALTLNGLPTDGTWVAGQQTYTTSKTPLGTSPNKYIVQGFDRQTNGMTHGAADWLERRTLTGT